MAESARIASRHRAGSVGSLLGMGPAVRRGGSRRGGAPERDFRRENVRAIRALERRVRQSREEEAAPAPHETFRLRRFDNVPSRLHRPPPAHLSRGDAAGPPPPAPAAAWGASAQKPLGFAAFTPPPRGGSQQQGPNAPATPSPAPRPRSLGRALQRASSVGALESRSWRKEGERQEADEEEEDGVTDAADIEATAEELRQLHLRQPRGVARDAAAQGAIARGAGAASSSTQQRRGQHQRHGSTPSPSSLAAAWWPVSAAAARQIELDVEDEEGFGKSELVVPLGYRLVPEAERLETLSDLQRKLADLNEKYTRLPLRIETEGQRQHQRALRDRIKDTELAAKLFSRPGGVLVEI